MINICEKCRHSPICEWCAEHTDEFKLPTDNSCKMFDAEDSEVARKVIDDIDDALHKMATEYVYAGHPEYYAVCEMVYHKVLRPTEKKYTEGEGADDDCN